VTAAKDNSELYELVKLSVAGDVSAFEKLYRMQTKNILYHTRSLMKSSADADDAAQEVVIAMLKSIGSLKDPYAFLPWMHRLIKFVCSKHIRKLKSIQDRQESADVSGRADTLADSDSAADVAGTVEKRERSRAIMRVIESLPERQREAVILYYFDELSYKEIAEAMKSTVSTVSTNIMKAKKNIKTELESSKLQDKVGGSVLSGGVLSAEISDAIGYDAEGKFPAGEVERFQRVCDGRIKDVQVNVRQVAKNRTALRAAPLKVAALVIVLTVVITGGILMAVQPDVGESLTGAAPPEESRATKTIDAGEGGYNPDVEIVLTGGDCECGHVNPLEAMAVLGDGDAGSVIGWQIISLKDNSVVNEGEGNTLSGALGTLSPGEYNLTFEIANAGAGRATASRKIDIIPGEIPPGVYR
jgi:RNA polymerase sigma factor (sigma-70 family)